MDESASNVQGTVTDNDIQRGETYAQRTARVLVQDNGQADLDAINNANTVVPPGTVQNRILTAFEKEHFHPLNVTPDRPCSPCSLD